MPPSTIITPRWNTSEVYSAIPTQDPESIAQEKLRVVRELHKLGHIRLLVEVKDLHAELVDLDYSHIGTINANTFFVEIQQAREARGSAASL